MNSQKTLPHLQSAKKKLHQEGQITPKLPVEQPAVPKRVTFTPGPLGNTMEGRGQSPGGDDQQARLVEFETIYRTLIEQNIPSEIASLAASQVLSGTRSSGPRYTSTPHCQPSQPRTQQVGDFEESRKIKYLVSKLMGPAGDFVEQYRLDHPTSRS